MNNVPVFSHFYLYRSEDGFHSFNDPGKNEIHNKQVNAKKDGGKDNHQSGAVDFLF